MLPITNPNSLPLLKRLLETNTPSTVPSKRYRPSYKWAVPRREVPLHYTYYSPIPKEALMPQLEKHKDPNEEDGYVSQFDKKWAMNKKEKQEVVKVESPMMAPIVEEEEEEEEKPKRKKREFRTIIFSNCLQKPLIIRVKNE